MSSHSIFQELIELLEDLVESPYYGKLAEEMKEVHQYKEMEALLKKYQKIKENISKK